jgi:endonuclease YncB( thermonuclease family)
MKTSILIILFSLLATNVSFNAKVVGVYSGDTIVISTNTSKQLKIRLEGIDCPELDQDYGDSAKMTTVSLCFKKDVRIDKVGIDTYGRTLAYVYVGDVCLNKELIRLGMAWHYKEYNADPELAKLEEEARNKKVGLWSQPSPKSPWDFRHDKKK